MKNIINQRRESDDDNEKEKKKIFLLVREKASKTTKNSKQKNAQPILKSEHHFLAQIQQKHQKNEIRNLQAHSNLIAEFGASVLWSRCMHRRICLSSSHRHWPRSSSSRGPASSSIHLDVAVDD